MGTAIGAIIERQGKSSKWNCPARISDSLENLHSSTDLTSQLLADANDMQAFTKRKRLGAGRSLQTSTLEGGSFYGWLAEGNCSNFRGCVERHSTLFWSRS